MPGVSGNKLTASGATLITIATNAIYAVTLVQYYSFMPRFDLMRQGDQIVDAIVYSKANTALDLSWVQIFMDVDTRGESQGY